VFIGTYNLRFEILFSLRERSSEREKKIFLRERRNFFFTEREKIYWYCYTNEEGVFINEATVFMKEEGHGDAVIVCMMM